MKLWFKAKRYGWGWTPACWQGWLVLGVYFAVLIALFQHADMRSHSGSDTLMSFFVPLVVITAVLFGICWKKGERPGWHWGDADDTPEK